MTKHLDKLDQELNTFVMVGCDPECAKPAFCIWVSEGENKRLVDWWRDKGANKQAFWLDLNMRIKDIMRDYPAGLHIFACEGQYIASPKSRYKKCPICKNSGFEIIKEFELEGEVAKTPYDIYKLMAKHGIIDNTDAYIKKCEQCKGTGFYDPGKTAQDNYRSILALTRMHGRLQHAFFMNRWLIYHSDGINPLNWMKKTLNLKSFPNSTIIRNKSIVVASKLADQKIHDHNIAAAILIGKYAVDNWPIHRKG